MTERQKMLADREMLDLWIKFVYEETMNGESRDYRHLDKIIRDVDSLVIINDEAHHIHDSSLAWFKNIEDISNQVY